jgi:hypothetical protein
MPDLEHPRPPAAVGLPPSLASLREVVGADDFWLRLRLVFFRRSGEPFEWPPDELNELIGYLFTMIRDADPIAAWSVAAMARLVSRTSWQPEPLIDVAMMFLTLLHVVAPVAAEDLVDIWARSVRTRPRWRTCAGPDLLGCPERWCP